MLPSGLFLLVLFVASAEGLRFYAKRLPNGENVTYQGQHWGPVGHSTRYHIPRNLFGMDFEVKGKMWSVELCTLDSDGDGRTNGEELGDPFCTWAPGTRPMYVTGITHPGMPDEAVARYESPFIPEPSPSPSSIPNAGLADDVAIILGIVAVVASLAIGLPGFVWLLCSSRRSPEPLDRIALTLEEDLDDGL